MGELLYFYKEMIVGLVSTGLSAVNAHVFWGETCNTHGIIRILNINLRPQTIAKRNTVCRQLYQPNPLAQF